MKVFGFTLTALIIFIGFAVPKVNAAVNFDITTQGGSGWVRDIYNYSVESGNRYSAVNWQYSNQSGHYMWFGVFNSSFIKKGQMLYTTKKSDAFLASLTTGTEAYLGARRENVGDPATRVTGIWAA